MKDQNQYSFWWFELKWCRPNYLKIVDLDSVKYLLYPCHTHTSIQYTVDTIALDSYEDVCGFCLWLNHPLRSASSCIVGSSNSVFVSNGWTVLCGDEIQLLQTPCNLTTTLSKQSQTWPHPSFYFHCHWLKYTHIPETSPPHLQCSRVCRLSYGRTEPVGLPGIVNLVSVLVPQQLNVGITVVIFVVSIDLAKCMKGRQVSFLKGNEHVIERL